MTRVAIVSPALLPGDAIGHDARHMGRLLAAAGHEVGLFSTTWGRSQPRDDAGRHVRSFLGGDRSAVLILHHAIGWRHAVPLAASARCRLVVKYHNVTPAHFYDALDPGYAGLCRDGRRQLRRLIERGCDLYLADSAFNRSELTDLGADPAHCVVVAPFHDVDGLLRTEPDAEVMRDYAGKTNLLFVGRRAPNKGHRLLLDAFALYREHCNPESRLVLLGRGEPRQEAYTLALRDQVRRLGLWGHVVFLDVATPAQLRALYERAAAFVTASEHEGFCVPLVEAMALGVPVVARGAGAVPETAGDAALVWDAPDPFVLAQSSDAVVRDGSVRRGLIERGRRRYREQFANGRIEPSFLSALAPLLSPPGGAAAIPA